MVDFAKALRDKGINPGPRSEFFRPKGCHVCGCPDCPIGLPCDRRAQDGLTYTPCFECGCLVYVGASLTEEEKQQMITVQRNNVAGNSGSVPRGVQFLSPRHIKKAEGHAAKITKVTTDKPDNFGNPYVVYFTMDGAKYSKGFKATSATLISLVDLLGEDEKKWLGKGVTIGKAVDDDGGERLTFGK